MPIIYKRSESPEFDLSDPKYQNNTTLSKHEVGIDVDELDLLPPVAVVSASSNATTKPHQQQRALSASSAPRSTPAKKNSSQAPPPKRSRVQEEQIPSDRVSTSTSRRPINAFEHHSSSDGTRRVPRPRPSPPPPPPPPKMVTTASKRTRPAPALCPPRVRREDDSIGKQHVGPSTGMPTPSISLPPRQFAPQRAMKQPPQASHQQPRQRSSPSAEKTPVVQDLSSSDHQLRPRRTIHPPDREMKLPSEQSPATKPPKTTRSATSSSLAGERRFLVPERRKRTDLLETTDTLPPSAARSAGPPRSDESSPSQQRLRERNSSPRASSETEANTIAVRSKRNEGLMRPASVRRAAQERRTNVDVDEEPTPPTRRAPRSILQDEPIELHGYPRRRTDPPLIPRRSFDTQASPPPPRPPQAQVLAQPPPSPPPNPKSLPKFQFPDVETFLANLPLPLTHLTPTVAAFGCSSQADLLALSARSEGGAKARRAMMDELEKRGDLTPWQRIVVEAELEVLGERAAGR